MIIQGLLAGALFYGVLAFLVMMPVFLWYTRITRWLDNPDWVFTPIGLYIVFNTYAGCLLFMAASGMY